MSSTGEKNKRDKQVLLDIDNSVRELTRQFAEQQRSLDIRTENKIFLVNDLQEFFRRRSELDLEYGKSLERLCDRFTERFTKQRANYGFSKKDRASYVNLWSKLLIDARFKAKTATNLSEIYTKNLVMRLTEIAEDVQRISKIVKDTHATLQQEIVKLAMQLQMDIKTYYIKHSEFIFSESKFKASEIDKRKAEDQPQKKGNEKRIKHLEKSVEKKQARYYDSQKNAIRTRNQYIQNVESLSAVLSKYFDCDVSEIINKFDHNFHDSFSSTLQAYIGAEIRMASAQIQSANSLAHTVSVMDIKSDNKMFLEDNDIFKAGMKFSFIPHAEDNVLTITAEQAIEAELTQQHRKLFDELKQLEVEIADLQSSIEKRKKGLESTYKKYDSDMNGFYHMDMSTGNGSSSPNSTLVSGPPSQLKVDKEEWENGLLAKFKELIMSECVQLSVQTKYNILTKALGEITSDASRNNSISTGKRAVKLFGTSLKQQLEDMKCEIPDIVESCTKYIAKYGLKHQGIFRVPGASQEINEMKVAFEEGRNPLSGLNHWKDINAVAGVFRLYFREMCEPLFPIILNQEYLRASSITRAADQIAEASSILKKIETWNLNVIKYILKFLNLISQHSEINKMTSHNLAVVFGPTLIRLPENENLLTNQGQMNIFMDVLINDFYQIFPEEHNDLFFEDSVDGNLDEEEDGGTEDELESEDELVEAIALYPYTARTSKEVSFNKGDVIQIFSRTNNDWWDAKVNGQFGFVPVSYLKVVERTSSLTSDLNEENKKYIKRSASLDTAEEVIETHIESNVFAALDPTIESSTDSRRTANDRLPKSPRTNIPSRTLSEKTHNRIPILPQSKPMVISQQDIQSAKLKSSNYDGETSKSLDRSNFSKNTFNEKSKPCDTPVFSSSLARQSPVSSDSRPNITTGRTVQGSIIKENPGRSDPIPSFKPPPPPASKPKGLSKKIDPNYELAATIHAAAAAKAQRNPNYCEDSKELTRF